MKKGVRMKTKISWWQLSIKDYPEYEPNDMDFEHIAEMIKQGCTQGQLIREEEEGVEDEQ